MCSRRIALLALVSQAAALAPPTPRARPCARCRRVQLRSEPGDAPAEAAAPVTEAVPIATTEPEPESEAPQLTERQKEIARLRAAEKFLEKDTGKYMCKVCEYQYDPEEGAKGVAACVEIKILQRVLLDGVAMPVPHRSTEPARRSHRREMA
jgi:hypothetical protein